MSGLRPLCRSYLSSTSFIYRLRPLCRDYVLYDGIASFMSELSVVYVLYLSSTSFICRLRPLSIVYVLYLSITSCMMGLRPVCRDCVLHGESIQENRHRIQFAVQNPRRTRRCFLPLLHHRARNRSTRHISTLLTQSSNNFTKTITDLTHQLQRIFVHC